MTDIRIPERISRLDEFSHNLWWSWHPEGRELFRALDYPLWRTSGHNPVKQIHQMSADMLTEAAKDQTFLKLYDTVLADFDRDLSTGNTWFISNFPQPLSGPVAYFSMEFAIHNSLPIYAGGLGVLAAEFCKEASDMGMPLVGVGFMYPQGYFYQHINPDGWQQEFTVSLTLQTLQFLRYLPRMGVGLLPRLNLKIVNLLLPCGWFVWDV